jgi:7-keto-8-aminopelargonate synthetase-like enzyme
LIISNWGGGEFGKEHHRAIAALSGSCTKAPGSAGGYLLTEDAAAQFITTGRRHSYMKIGWGKKPLLAGFLNTPV